MHGFADTTNRSGAVLLAAVALACGGCFAPAESSSQVTDHRMALSVGVDRTTLYRLMERHGLQRGTIATTGDA